MFAAKTQPPRSKSAPIAETTKSSAQPLPPEAAFNPLWGRLALGIQPKLAVSAPDDPFEREADRVAAAVMRMPAPVVRRKCAACSAGGATCPDCEEEARVQRKADGTKGAGEVGSDFASRLHGGSPLAAASRAFFEPRFGQDFGGVRVHTGPEAATAARSINARAFTFGRNVAFAAGEYEPGSLRGRRLLAHELVHVLQDGAGTTLRRQPSGSGAPTPAAPPAGVCGPNVDSEVTRVWTRVQTDFRGTWSDAQRRDACLMLIEPIITVTNTASGPVSAHSAVGLGILDLARASFEGLSALNRILLDAMRGSVPSGADIATLEAAAATAANAAQTIGTDLAVRIDRLLSLSRSIAQIARDAPGVLPPLQRIVDSIVRGSLPRTTDLAALAVAAGTLAGSVADLVTRFAAAADVVQRAISRLISGQGAVVAVDTVLQALGIKLNRDAFDIVGLYQGSMRYTRDPAFGYFPTCATPGSPRPAAGDFDAAHEARDRCSNTIQVGGVCWLSGTPNYGTYGIMMRECFNWTGGGRAPADMQRFNFAFTRRSTELFARGYKALDADSPSAPGDWALATFDSGPSARIGGGNRTHCNPSCSVAYRRPGHFDYVWEPVKPRSRANFT